MLRKEVILAVVVIVIVASAIGLYAFWRTHVTPPPQEIELFVIGHDYEPDTLDLHATVWADITSLLVYGTMIVLDWRDGSFLGMLAESWEFQEGGKVLIIHLKDGLKFADGTPLNATCVKYTFDRMVQMESPSLAIFGPLNRTEVVDNLTVKLVFNEPFAPLLITLANSYFGIFNPNYINKVGNETYGRKPLAAGPFYVTEWKSGDYILYTRNEYYIGRPDMVNQGPVPIKQIKIKFILDPASLVAAMEAGEVDMITSIPAEFYPDLVAKNNTDIIVKTFLSQEIRYFGFNCAKWPFNDTRVRQAVSILLGSETIREQLKEINFNLSEPLWGPLPPSIPGYKEEIEEYAKESMAYSLTEDERIQQALQLLKEAGWEDRDGDGILEYVNGSKFEFPLLVPREFYKSEEAELLVNELKKAGLKFDIQILDTMTIKEQLVHCKHYAFLFLYGWMDPMILRYLFHSEGVKRTWFSTPELDELLDKMTTTVDPEERQQYIDQVCKYLIDNCPWVPLYAPKAALAWKAIYTGIIINMYEGGTILWEDITMGRGG